MPPGGEHWGCFSIDRRSRFIVAWASGVRDADLASAVVGATRQRTAGRAGIGWISDGWTEYVAAMQQVYYDPVACAGISWTLLLPTARVALTQALKHRQGRRLKRVEVRAVLGEQAPQPYTVHVERQNGVLRDRLACLTRKPHAFAKTGETWTAVFSLALFEHNWVRPHVALQRLLDPPAADRRVEQRTPSDGTGPQQSRVVADGVSHPASLSRYVGVITGEASLDKYWKGEQEQTP